MQNLNILPSRDEIDEKYKWKLDHIYESEKDWENDYDKIDNLLNDVTKYRGKLKEDSKNIFNCLNNYVKLLTVVDKIFVYSRMKKDEDNSKSKYQSLTSKSMTLITKVSSEISFINPEITNINKDKIFNDMETIEGFKLYKHFISEIFRQKEHCLSEKEEIILAMGLEVSTTSGNVFSMLNNVDIKFPKIKDENGNMVELTKGRYIKFLESNDQRVRKDAFVNLYSSYSSYKNTLATLLISNVKKNLYHSKVRNYDSSLKSSLDQDNIDISVYNNLIETVSANLPVFHKYLEIKRKMLGLNKLNLYDLFAPISTSKRSNIRYEEALEIIENSLGVLGDEYINNLKKGFNSGWIDVYETKDKTSGAYSWGAYSTHPYVLLNYQGSLNDISTIAHEMGHALHSYYTNETQPYIYSEYKIFVAEVASTVNESILIKHLINNTKDLNEKKYLLNHYLEEFRGTLFRQTMFAEFEKIIHENVESGNQLTLESINEIYYNLNIKYFGKAVNINKEIELEWSRIPHFYSSFYVYKYATGFSAATAIAKNIVEGKENSTSDYINFLKSGDSDYPIELLKKTGVDLTTPEPIQNTMDIFKNLVDEFEKLI
ncbi:MAG: oligoendopeptidase F [Clostridiales bacterium]